MDKKQFLKQTRLEIRGGVNISTSFRHFFSYIQNELPALMSGILLTLSFPKAGFSGIAFFAIVPLLISLKGRSGKGAFQAGVTTGLVHFISLLCWIVPTIHGYGGVPLVLAIPALVLLGFYLALYPGIFAWGLAREDKASFGFPVKAAALWSALEYLRSLLMTGFPWGLLGHTQYSNLPLIQIADITGVYGISFGLVLTNGVAAQVWAAVFGQKRVKIEVRKRILAASLVMVTAIWTGILIYGNQRLETIHKEIIKAPQSRVTVLQGNIHQAVKWDAAFQKKTVETYCSLTRTAVGDDPDLMIWPETALPFYYTWDLELSNMVDTCVRQAGIGALIGSPAFESPGEKLLYFNRAYMVDRFGVVTATYDKVHLVPFGEYVPFGRFFRFFDKLTAQAGDFSQGDATAPPLSFGQGRAGVLICFEIIFPDLARRAVKNGANLLVTITNDAWFGASSAPLQHFSQAVFRAVETRRFVVRAANTGISGFIDSTGKILAATPQDQAIHMTLPVSLLDEESFYLCQGDLFALVCLVISLIISLRHIAAMRISAFSKQDHTHN